MHHIAGQGGIADVEMRLVDNDHLFQPARGLSGRFVLRRRGITAVVGGQKRGAGRERRDDACGRKSPVDQVHEDLLHRL